MTGSTRVRRRPASSVDRRGFADPGFRPADSIDLLRDRGLNHVAPNGHVANGSHRLVRLAHCMKHRFGLVHMLAPREVDFVAGRWVTAFGVATQRGPSEYACDAFNQRTIGFGHGCSSLFPFNPLATVWVQSPANSPPAPIPPPTHIVTTTSFTPRRLPSISA